MAAIFQTPEPDAHDRAVIAEVNAIKSQLGSSLRAPARWAGGLRRTTQARAVRGSNTIEGYTVTPQDALAAVDAEAPLSSDQDTWAEIQGYRRVLTYVVNVATGPRFRADSQTLDMLHFMLLEHDLGKSPGRYRGTEIYVRDERDERTVYQGPPPELVPELVEALVVSLNEPSSHDSMVRAAMAHLNLVMIHPYRDGNGRMARIVQTMVMARDHVVSPEFASIEEWLGNNTDDYYRVLGLTGQGAWHPENDAHPWLQFTLRAHHMQAHTLLRRFREAERLWVELDRVVAEQKIPERTQDALFDAYLGGRVTRSSYLARSGLGPQTSGRDLQRLADLGLLEARGETRNRHYLAGSELLELRRRVVADRPPIDDPYPDLRAQLLRA